MKTQVDRHTNGHSKEGCGCAPCAVEGFCRTAYYTGKLLTARDFMDEQRYHIDKLRLHHMLLHGWGTVCGLRVKPHPHCPGLRVVVEAGLAIDECGREVRLLRDIDLPLPQPPPAEKKHDDCPPDPNRASPRQDDDDAPRRPPAPECWWVC